MYLYVIVIARREGYMVVNCPSPTAQPEDKGCLCCHNIISLVYNCAITIIYPTSDWLQITNEETYTRSNRDYKLEIVAGVNEMAETFAYPVNPYCLGLSSWTSCPDMATSGYPTCYS